MHDRRTPRAAIFVDLFRTLAGVFFAPDFLARLFVECGDKRIQTWAEIEHHEISINDRTAAEAPDVLDFAQVFVPQHFSVRVVSIDSRRAVPRDYALAVT